MYMYTHLGRKFIFIRGIEHFVSIVLDTYKVYKSRSCNQYNHCYACWSSLTLEGPGDEAYALRSYCSEIIAALIE